MIYKVRHTTAYQYLQTTALCYNEAWMRPRSLPEQIIKSTEIKLEPDASLVRIRKDYFGNEVVYFTIQQAHDAFEITATSLIERTKPSYHNIENPPNMSWEKAIAYIKSGQGESYSAEEYSLPSPLIFPAEELAEYAKPSFTPERPLFEAVYDLMKRIFREFEYKPHFTTVSTPIKEALEARKGVCQDFAHIAIGCLRSLGLPARYISGYIETLPPEGETELVGSAASHAWFSAFIPELGWVDFDPTNDQIPGDQHISVAWGRDYSDVPPLKGVIFSSSGQKLTVEVDVIRQKEENSDPDELSKADSSL